MLNKFIISSILLVSVYARSYAQIDSYNIWSQIELEKTMGKARVSISGELRNSDFLNKVSRYGLCLEMNYKLLKPIDVGIGYEYYNIYDAKYSDYQPRQRFNLSVQGEHKFGRFTISLREKLQRTIKDESDRMTESGSYDTYKVNPEYSWRNRLRVKYNIPNFPVTPAVSAELFYQLNNPDKNSFNQSRFILSFNYNLTKSQKLEVFGLMDREFNVSNPVTVMAFGFGYKISLNKNK